MLALCWLPSPNAYHDGAGMTESLELNNDVGRTSSPGVIRRSVINALPLLLLLLLFNAATFGFSLIASRVFGIAFLLVVPGAVLMSLTSVQPREASVRVALTVGASILFLMVLGLLYSLVLPHLGIARPLTRISVLIGIDAATVIGLAVQVRHRDPLAYLMEGDVPSTGKLVVAGLISLLPLGAVCGAELLNNGKSNVPAVVELVIVGVVLCGLVVCIDRIPRWSVSMVLYCASAAVLLMASMRSNYPFGFDIQSEYYVFSETLRNGIWHLPSNGNPYSAMLSITVLPATISLVTHATGIYLFKLVYPLVFSIFPVLVYVSSARWFPSRAALIGAVVLIVQGFYSADMTGLARQEIGLLYFGLLVVVAFDESIRRRPRQIVAVIAGVGMAISHYSTAYFACTILIFGFFAQLLLRRSHWWRSRWQILLTLPVVVGIVGVVTLWNVVITRSAQNALNLASSVQANGFRFLPGSSGSSLITRFLNSDVSPTVSSSKFSSIATAYYHRVDSVNSYPLSLTKLFPLQPANVPAAHTSLPALYGNLASDLSSVSSELLLLMIGIGIVVFLWRQRKSVRGGRAEFGFIALGCVFLLAILRLSGTVSSLYNAPRGQVQGAPLLSIGIACVCAWMFTGRSMKRCAFTALATIGLGLLMFTDSGLSGLVLGGGVPDTLVNYGSAYESYYFTTADIETADWLVLQHAKGQVVYTDEYGAIQLDEVSQLNRIIPTTTPQVVEPGAFVFATSTNVVDRTAQSNVDNIYGVYKYPLPFLNSVKNVVFTTGTTEVFR
jgi:uncharacterized membrane protein